MRNLSVYDDDGTWTRDERDEPLTAVPVVVDEGTRPHNAPERIQRFWRRQPHGSHYRYRSGCRCEPCRKGAAAYKEHYRQRKLARGFAVDEHGRYSTYTTGCRCRDCRDAARDYQRERRRRKKAL